MKTQRWQDWLMLTFGVWLFLSPFWMPGYETAATWNSLVLGVLVALFAVWALASPRRWEAWVQLALGAWLVLSPFVLDFEGATAAWNTIILGVLIGLDAVWALAAYPARRVRT